MTLRTLLLLPLLLLLAAGPLQAGEYARERKLFREAEAALNAGKRDEYARLSKRLRDYPLYPYLEYTDLLRRLPKAEDGEIERFLERYKETVLAYRLRGKWLLQLGKQRAWQRFARYNDGRDSTTLKCYALRVDYHAGRRDTLLEQVERIWLSGKSQPKACDPLFELLEASPRLTSELLWKRIGLAVDVGNLSLANYLAKKLSKVDRERYALWKRIRRDPETGLREAGLKLDDQLNRRIVRYGIKRLARRDAIKAWLEWQRLATVYRFGKAERVSTVRYIIVRGALQQLPETLDWIEQLDPAQRNDEIYRWQAKLAIHRGDWPLLKRAITALPADQRQEKVWRYWLAYAERELGERARSEERLAELATTTHYYGFLAAERLGLGHALESKPLLEDRGGIQQTAKRPELLRIRELLHFERTIEARREWEWLLRRLDNRETRHVALLAREWGWHDGAILSAARAGHFGDLELRFPTPYRELVVKSAKQQRIDAEWVYGILRRESAFMRDAQSGAGARGLMQLMPHTARELSKSIGIKRLRLSELFIPSRNIQLGSSYLRRMLDRFNGNQALATAAYNAGPYRVDAWLPEQGAVDADRWVELIPYSETRDYVKAVMAYTTIFDDKLNGHTTPLKRRMPPVKK